MKIIKLKTYFKRCIYASESGLRVYQNFVYRWMTFNSRPIQTLIRRRNPQTPLLTYLSPLTLAARFVPGETCLLGLGGGAAAHQLMPVLNGKNLDVVEISAEVIDIAKRYFQCDQLINTRIIQTDAASYIKDCTKKYQNIIIDLFDAKSYPKDCNTESFFQSCFKQLNSNGILAVNLASTNEQWSVFKKICKYFDQGIVTVPIAGSANVVLIASKTKKMDALLELFYQNQKIKMQYWDSDWGYIVEI